METTGGKSYDALLGFSQGGVFATALAISGAIPGVKAVVTAGSPMVEEAFHVAKHVIADSEETVAQGLQMPKLHLAGETDSLVSVDSTKRMCDEGGAGEFIIHEQGHLFPTRAVRVNYMIEFLAAALNDDIETPSD